MSKDFDILSYLMGKQDGGGGGGGGDITVESKSIDTNGTYTAPSGKAYSPVIVDVPNSYAAGDEGKVVSNGALVAQTDHAEVTENGTYDTTLNNSVTVNVDGGGKTIAPMDYPVTITNNRVSGTITLSYLAYDQGLTLSLSGQVNLTQASPSQTYADVATDGTHIWIRATASTTVYYNGERATFVRSGSTYMVTIPAGYDGTIPFLFS